MQLHAASILCLAGFALITIANADGAAAADQPVPEGTPAPAAIAPVQPSGVPAPSSLHPLTITLTPVYTLNAGGRDQQSAGSGNFHHEVQLNYSVDVDLGRRLHAYFTHFNVDPTPERVFVRGRAINPGAVAEYYDEFGITRDVNRHIAVALGYRHRIHKSPVNDADTSCTPVGNCGVPSDYQGPLVGIRARYGPYGGAGVVVTYAATIMQVLRSPLPAMQKLAIAQKQPYSPGLLILNTNILGVALTRYRPLQPFLQVGTQEDEFQSKLHPTTENITHFGVVHPIDRNLSLTISDFNFRGTHQGVTFPGAETTRFNVFGVALSYTLRP